MNIKMKTTKFFLSVLVTQLVVACSLVGPRPEGSVFGGKRVSSAAASQMIDPEVFENFNDERLVALLDPEADCDRARPRAGTSGNTAAVPPVPPVPAITNFDVEAAFNCANEKSLRRRSQVQDRLIAASNQRCNAYGVYLKRLSTAVNSTFGVLTTVLAGAGAIATGEDTARALAGLSGITSGTRAELNQAIFESVVTSVIVPALNQRREEIHNEILAKRNQPISQYTVEAAVADAIKYHGACSINEGIAYAEKSLASFEDVGLSKLSESLEKFRVIRERVSEVEALKGETPNKLAAQVITESTVTLGDINSEIGNLAAGTVKNSSLAAHNTLQPKLAPGGSYVRTATSLDAEWVDLQKRLTTGDEDSKKQTKKELIAQQGEVLMLEKEIQKEFQKIRDLYKT